MAQAKPPRRRSRRSFSGALSLLRPRSAPHVTAVSAQSGRGIPELLNWLAARVKSLRDSGELGLRRAEQLQQALASSLTRELLARVAADARASALLPELQRQVGSGQLLPTAAARRLVAALLG